MVTESTKKSDGNDNTLLRWMRKHLLMSTVFIIIIIAGSFFVVIQFYTDPTKPESDTVAKIPIESDVVEKIPEGTKPEETKKDQTDNRAELERLYAQLVTDIGKKTEIASEFLYGILESMGEAITLRAPEKIKAVLQAKTNNYFALKKRLDNISIDDQVVQGLQEQIPEALNKGDFVQAEALLLHAIEQKLNQLSIPEERIVTAEMMAMCGDVAMLQFNPTSYRKAAGYYAEAAGIVASTNVDLPRNYQMQKASILVNLGTEFGATDALEEGVILYKEILKQVDRTKEGFLWAAIKEALGVALVRLDARKNDTARLEEAIAAYRDALQEFTREKIPSRWATTQCYLGNALRSLGQREKNVIILEDAIAAYKLTLEIWTEESMPAQHTIVVNTLNSTQALIDKLIAEKGPSL